MSSLVVHLNEASETLKQDDMVREQAIGLHHLPTPFITLRH